MASLVIEDRMMDLKMRRFSDRYEYTFFAICNNTYRVWQDILEEVGVLGNWSRFKFPIHGRSEEKYSWIGRYYVYDSSKLQSDQHIKRP